MTPLALVLVLGLISLAAGALGSVVGLGGGVVVVPVLTLLFHIDIRLAIGASIVAVIATSSGAAAAYVRDRLTNLRAGMFLEVATTTGAICGAFLTTVLPVRALFVIFALVVGVSAFATFRKRHAAAPLAASNDRIADALKLHGSYFDPAEGREVAYKVTGTKLGLAIMYAAGLVSALLGVGSGVLKVPALDLAMHVPIKVSSATSNFMIGVTAAASAGVYFTRGDVDPIIAAPVAVGVLAGSLVGARVLGRITSKAVRLTFVAVMVVICVEMLQRGVLG